ncbi:hypothetical protein CEE44_02785 [Candidatus Woesearchaeota archaeon B3_Woes]|nr:MAG: hypothetical protein CEE44_02785 [Candidatus Woesearchaeota archaeon B3_Woes]
MEHIYLILIISVIGPVLGSFIGVIRKPSKLFMYNMLAFAAGVMITISIIELIPKSIEFSSVWLACLGIIIGTASMYLLDKLIPHIHPELCEPEQGRKLKRTSVYLLIGIFMHNFPEGIAIASGIVTNFKTALTISLAIAIQNIPEGICTSAPYYYCTKKKLKSFLLSSSTAIPILLGFYLGYLVFPNIPLYIVGIIIAATAGIMIYISADELIPTSCNKCNNSWNHSVIFSLIIGVLFVIILTSI